VQLPSGPATRMTVGAEIAEPHPATIVTVWMGVKWVEVFILRRCPRVKVIRRGGAGGNGTAGAWAVCAHAVQSSLWVRPGNSVGA